MKTNSILLLAAAALVLTACSGDDRTPAAAGQDNQIRFTVETVRTIDLSRGTMMRQASELGSIGVSAYQTAEGVTDLTGVRPDFFHKQEARRVEGTNTFRLGSDYEWPRNGDEKGTQLTFFAYTPYDNPNVELSGANVTGTPTLTYTVPATYADQIDLMTCQTNGTRFKSDVALTMDHRLCAVRFQIGNNFAKGVLKSITLRGVRGKGIYTFGQAGWDFSNFGYTDFTLTLDKAVEGNNAEELLVTDEAFLMIPQTLTDQAVLEVVFLPDGETKDVVMSQTISGTWAAGKVVTYGISSAQLKDEYNRD